jgi:hypothetical protein
LNPVRAEATDTHDRKRRSRTEYSCGAQLLQSPVRRQSGVGQRRQRQRRQVPADLDQLLVGDGDVLLIAAVRAEPDPVPLVADVLVAAVALAAGTVAERTEDHHGVAFGQARGLGDVRADPVDRARDLMSRRRR